MQGPNAGWRRRPVEAAAGQAAGQSGRGADPAGESVHTPTMEERPPFDLDNGLPCSGEIERLAADSGAGRPMGKTHAAEEYLRHLDQLLGGEDARQADKQSGLQGLTLQADKPAAECCRRIAQGLMRPGSPAGRAFRRSAGRFGMHLQNRASLLATAPTRSAASAKDRRPHEGVRARRPSRRAGTRERMRAADGRRPGRPGRPPRRTAPFPPSLPFPRRRLRHGRMQAPRRACGKARASKQTAQAVADRMFCPGRPAGRPRPPGLL